MDHFYVILQSDTSRYYYHRNTIAYFRSELTRLMEIELDKWEIGLVEISYP